MEGRRRFAARLAVALGPVEEGLKRRRWLVSAILGIGFAVLGWLIAGPSAALAGLMMIPVLRLVMRLAEKGAFRGPPPS